MPGLISLFPAVESLDSHHLFSVLPSYVFINFHKWLAALQKQQWFGSSQHNSGGSSLNERGFLKYVFAFQVIWYLILDISQTNISHLNWQTGHFYLAFLMAENIKSQVNSNDSLGFH